MEGLVTSKSLQSFYHGRSVLITGHTGFKGGWLGIWLKHLGASVTGFSLPPEKGRPSFFEVAQVGRGMESVLGDIRNRSALREAFVARAPEVVFHLAAQALVKRSYEDPIETFSTNVMGTVNILETVRESPSVRTVVIVTSDKCYENRDRDYAYRETDPMGGRDPYSSSKGAAELVTTSYRQSFFPPQRLDRHGVGIASARAGNVIGGGDWAEDRLVPDCIRALKAGLPVPVRNPRAIRPWQHVLEPLSGYLWLAVRLQKDPKRFAEAWNFGPDPSGNAAVRDVVGEVVEEWGEGSWERSSETAREARSEAAFLRLNCTKAASALGWRPVWSLKEAVHETVAWYRLFYSDTKFQGDVFCVEQIDAYTRKAIRLGLPWAQQAEVEKIQVN